jgi:hypothetical protein
VVLLVVRDRRHDRRKVATRGPILERLVDQHRARLSVGFPREHVPDVVEIPRDARQVGLALIEPQTMQDLVGDARHKVGVAEPVLRVAHPFHHAIGRGDEERELGIGLDLFEGDRGGCGCAGTSGLARFAHEDGWSSSSDWSS